VRALISGSAGFIGSNLTDYLLDKGWGVLGIDNFSPYYSSKIKHNNLSVAKNYKNFKLVKMDLSSAELLNLLEGVDVVFHLAGQPGVRSSWGASFSEYLNTNVLASQRLLEAVRQVRSIKAVVAASSSSVYGSAETFPTTECVVPKPVSPYGVSKLAAEHLFTLYASEFGVPAASLRFFTVYGPRQRPDMAITRLFLSALFQVPFLINGDGHQERDFTFVQDVVDALVRVAEALLRGEASGSVFNVGSENPVSLLDVVKKVEAICGNKIPLEFASTSPGDPIRTGSNCSEIRHTTGWRPATRLEDGLTSQYSHILTSIPDLFSRPMETTL
jgi:UDP-glucuronate 4-epimerase